MAVYLEAVHEGHLDSVDIERVLIAAHGVRWFSVRREAIDPLVDQVMLITHQLARANAYRLPELESRSREGSSMAKLRRVLEAQLQILKDAE